MKKGKDKSLFVLIGICVGCFLVLGIMNLFEDDSDASSDNTTSEYESDNSVVNEEQTDQNVVETENNNTDDTTALTVENSEDLKALLEVRDPGDQYVSEFAEKYDDREIEFDACIVSILNHEDYDTRYDILIYVGDYEGEGFGYGPSFQFEDVGVYDLGVDDLYLPDYISERRNVHVVAKVDEYEESSQLFKLDPVLVTAR